MKSIALVLGNPQYENVSICLKNQKPRPLLAVESYGPRDHLLIIKKQIVSYDSMGIEAPQRQEKGATRHGAKKN
jgi:hypothetical protein